MRGFIDAEVVYVEKTRGGVEIQTARTRREMLSVLMLNSGEEFAIWAEQEAKRCADIWRTEIENADTGPYIGPWEREK